MGKGTARKTESRLVRELDSAIALLTRVRALAATDSVSDLGASKSTSSAKRAKRELSTEAREAIAAAQRRRWAKVRRQKKKALSAASAK